MHIALAGAQQYAMMRTVQEKECQELQKAIEYINERHNRPMSLMERQQKLIGEMRELRDKVCQKIGSWTTGSRRRNWICWREKAGDGGPLEGKKKYQS